MNIEIANRLLEFRKQNKFSQEELAEKIGISRQAVSKWECAESSPDLDNLVSLAELYGVTVDELLFGASGERNQTTAENESNEPKEYVSIGLGGIHVKDGDTEVHIGLKEGVRVFENGKKVKINAWHKFPFPVLVTIAYLIMGFGWRLWHPGWVVFLTIPLYYFMVEAIFGKNPEEEKKNKKHKKCKEE